MTLTQQERDVLAFEARWWKHRGAKEQAMKDELDLSVPRYYQLLGAVVDKPESLKVDPVTVNRVRRLRDTMRRARTG